MAPAPRYRGGALDAGRAARGADRLALVSDGKKLYAVGGETATGITGEVTIYDPRRTAGLPGPSNLLRCRMRAAVFLTTASTCRAAPRPGGVTSVLERYDPQPKRGRPPPRYPSLLRPMDWPHSGEDLPVRRVGWQAVSRRDVRLRSLGSGPPPPRCRSRGLSWASRAKDSI